jgi:hypothetical protein
MNQDELFKPEDLGEEEVKDIQEKLTSANL